MKYFIYKEYPNFQICLGDYSEGLDIMFIRSGGKVVQEYWEFFNKSNIWKEDITHLK